MLFCDKFVYIRKEIGAFIVVDLAYYRLCKIERENTQKRFCVDDISAAVKVDFVRICYFYH